MRRRSISLFSCWWTRLRLEAYVCICFSVPHFTREMQTEAQIFPFLGSTLVRVKLVLHVYFLAFAFTIICVCTHFYTHFISTAFRN